MQIDGSKIHRIIESCHKLATFVLNVLRIMCSVERPSSPAAMERSEIVVRWSVLLDLLLFVLFSANYAVLH